MGRPDYFESTHDEPNLLQSHRSAAPEQRWWRHADSKKDLKGNELLIAAARLSEEPLKLNNFSLLITASLGSPLPADKEASI